ncbi:hypothetical protein QJS66_04685 [Kocuria rhizophila]|nr:hypothetical protein QJS66_04685 [Kocuria rhizophila]
MHPRHARQASGARRALRLGTEKRRDSGRHAHEHEDKENPPHGCRCRAQRGLRTDAHPSGWLTGSGRPSTRASRASSSSVRPGRPAGPEPATFPAR